MKPHKTPLLLLLSFSALAVAACQATPKMEDAQYWQRKNSTSALYLRGPKAQQTLHTDIASCVNEISELERMGAIRDAIPADTERGRVPDPNSADGKLRKWDSPKRDGFLYAEHFNYTDFEGCMDYKGWERIEALPYGQAHNARQDYLRNVHGQQFQSKQNVNPQQTAQQEQPASGYKSSEGMKINE
ncbi:MAG: hypothetical protein WC989_00650 [Micavibrio sp.]